jgi:DNA polymerase elongation subunit (family B)
MSADEVNLSVRKNIIFKAMYWSFEDTEDNTLIIHVSGMTETQKTVQLQVEKFTPYVYLQLPFKIPGGGNWTNDKCKKVYEYFKASLKNHGPLSYKLKKKEILHFREEGIFMFLTFSTNRACIEFERKCSRKNFIPGVGMIEDGVFKVHEQNIDPILKFTAMKKLLLAGWVCCTKETVHEDEIGLEIDERKFSTADIDFYCHYQNMNPYEMKKTVILHPVYCSFDIECNSQNHNSKLPDPKNPENKVFQISMVFGKFGKEEQEVYLLSLFNPLEIEGSKVIRFKKEKDLLLYFSKMIRKKDPLFFIGYNIMKFDWTYMIERAEKFGYLPKFLDISRIVGKKAELKKSSWSSSAYGDQEFKFPDCFGRTQLDVLVEIERNYRLPTYSLDAVSEKFLNEHKDDITPRQLFMFYKITDDLLEIVENEEITDLQKQIKHILPFRKTHGVVRRHRRKMLNCQSKEELTLLIRECLTMTLRYCKQDTILPIRLVNKLNLVTTMEEMSNVMHVPMSYLHTRGQQIKVLAQIFRETIGENIVIPYNKKDPNKEPENYEGAIVVEAHAGDYNHVGTLDFCLTGDTLISTSNGVSIPLKEIASEDKVIGWDGESFGEYTSQGIVYKGEKETVKIWLQDGTTITATPDHKFMLDNGEMCRADDLEGKYIKCGFEQPRDFICEKEKDWILEMETLKLNMNTKKDRDNALAFSRLLGYILSDGSIYVTTDKKGRTRKCCEVSMGTMIDAKDIMKDIFRLCGKEVTIRKRSRGVKGTTYCITIPVELSKNIHSIENIVIGKRATQPMKLPFFILDENCPLSIIREFLAGLFGGDGTAPFYQKGRHSSFGPLVLKWTTIEKYKNEMENIFGQIKKLLLKFNIESKVLQKRIFYGTTSIKPKNIEEDNCRWDVYVALPTDQTNLFQEKIGFRYCINKNARLTVTSSYYKMKEKIREQQERVIKKSLTIRSENISTRESLTKARKKIFLDEPPLDDISMASVEDFSKRKTTKTRIEHLTTEKYLFDTNTEEWFNMQDKKSYTVSSDSEIVPSFRKKVIGVFKNGVEHVYDVFNVDKVHNYLAGGVVVSNCSLYPTTMIAFNICYTTLVRDNNIPDRDCHVLEWTSHVGCPHDPLKRKKKKGDRVIMVCGDYKCRFLKVKYTYDEESGAIIRENEGIMPRLERNLLTSRKEVKKEMFRAEARLAMNRGEATEEDIAFYKKCGMEIVESGSLSKEEDKIVETVAGILNAKQLAIKVSANSCSADTPILCLINDRIEYKHIEDLFIEKSFCDEKGNEFCTYENRNIKVWSDDGWTDIKYVFRHFLKEDEKVIEIQTLTGCVEVTEDHSLLDEFGNKLKYEELQKNQELLSVDLPLPKDTPNEFVMLNSKECFSDEIPCISDLINSSYENRCLFISEMCNIFTKGFMEIKSKLEAAKMYFLLESVGFKVCMFYGNNDVYVLNFGETNKLPSYLFGTRIVKTKGYVYDIETSSHHFAAGIGDLIVHNSAYGALGAGQGFIPLIQGAASVTAMGRKLITLAVAKIKKEWSNCKLIYGDSVVRDTPILIRDKNTLITHIINIYELEYFGGKRWKNYPLFKMDESERREKQRINIKNIEIWTEKGWSCIKRLIKHKVNKKIYRVFTKNGIVDVTEDHSLLDEKSIPVKPKDVHVGEKLLTSFPNYFMEECIYDSSTETFDYENIPFHILNGSHENKIRFLEGYQKKYGSFSSKSKLVSQKLYYLLKSCGYENLDLEINENYKINFSNEDNEKNKITRVEILYETYDDYVYDIETESGHFHAGVGEIILKNTDSCMIFFENCTLKECFENCERASRVVTHYLKMWILGVEEDFNVKNMKSGESFPLNKITTKSKDFKDLSYEHKIKVIEYESIPTDLTFEKVYGRFLLLTKKRYIAYTVNKDGKIIETTKKGVVLTRRDNSQSLRTTYKKVSDGILDRKDEKEVMDELYDEIHKLFTRQIPETNFIIYLGVKKIIEYAKKKKFSIGNKQEEFFIDAKGHPIEDPSGPLDPRLVYPNLPQVLLALKLLNRGTDVPPNTRLEHIYVENSLATHQGQKAEDYTYYKENKDVEDFKIDYLHYLEKLQAPITELIKVKYPKKDIVLYEKLEDAVKRILSNNNIDEFKRITLSRVSKIVKTVEEYEDYEVGWKVLKKGKIKKFIIKKEQEYPRNTQQPFFIYEFKGVNAKIEHIIQSSKKDSLNDFSINNPIEREMIEISKTYKSRVIIDTLHARYKVKKRPYKKPTQTGEKIIKNTKVKIKCGAYEGRYGKIYNLFEIENTKPKKYTFQVLLDDEPKVIENIPREYIITYRFRDDNIMKDIYTYRCFYKNVVEELNKLFNPVVFED